MNNFNENLFSFFNKDISVNEEKVFDSFGKMKEIQELQYKVKEMLARIKENDDSIKRICNTEFETSYNKSIKKSVKNFLNNFYI